MTLAILGGKPVKRFIQALHAEGIPTQASYLPLHQLDLFQNDEFRKRPAADHASEPFEFIRNEYPVSEGAAANTVWLVHAALLGSEQDTREIVEAVKKVQQHAGELAATY